MKGELETTFYHFLSIRDEVSEFFDRMDRDYDGRLSFGEFMGEETPLEKVFKNMDKDGDGTVSKEVRFAVSGRLFKKTIFLFVGICETL